MHLSTSSVFLVGIASLLGVSVCAYYTLHSTARTHTHCVYQMNAVCTKFARFGYGAFLFGNWRVFGNSSVVGVRRWVRVGEKQVRLNRFGAIVIAFHFKSNNRILRFAAHTHTRRECDMSHTHMRVRRVHFDIMQKVRKLYDPPHSVCLLVCLSLC